MNRYEWLDEYLLAKPGAEKDYKTEWGWFRYRVCEKQFAAVCTPGPEYVVHKERMMVLLKCDPELARLFRREYPDVVPGFYSNKDTWNDVLKSMCDMSYELIIKKLPKREQLRIAGE